MSDCIINVFLPAKINIFILGMKNALFNCFFASSWIFLSTSLKKYLRFLKNVYSTNCMAFILAAKQHFRQTFQIILILAYIVIINKIHSLNIFKRKENFINVINVIIVFSFIVYSVFTFHRPLTFSKMIVTPCLSTPVRTARFTGKNVNFSNIFRGETQE